MSTAFAAAKTMAPRRTWQEAREVLERLHGGEDRVAFTQRLVEIPIALVALILSAPIMAVLAILVKLDSPGPALFRHYRVGKGGRLFHFTKFRTLYVDAKKRFPHLYAYDYTQEEVDKLCFKIPNDPRVTRLGRWLRQSTLDELPNFWHVLVGDMSLVGPRPEIPEMLSYYTDEELAKFSVRPGITGLAQISGRGRLTFRDTVAYDLDYVRDHSFRSDFHIVMMTVWKILLRDGAF